MKNIEYIKRSYDMIDKSLRNFGEVVSELDNIEKELIKKIDKLHMLRLKIRENQEDLIVNLRRLRVIE